MAHDEKRTYPREVKIGHGVMHGAMEVREMRASDEAAVLAFAKALPKHDLLFLPRNISEPRVLAAWIKEIERGQMRTLLAQRAGKVAACATLVRDELSWSAHVGEIRMVVAPDQRGVGLGRALAFEAFALAIETGLDKILVQMTVDQVGAIAIFESLGFRGEALLRDQVKDLAGKPHDIVVLGHHVAKFQAQMQAFGVPAAV